jgi:hypothetical protein
VNSVNYPNFNSILQTCSLNCAAGYYLNANLCLACDSTCATCNIIKKNCTSCNTSTQYKLYNQILNTCTVSCVDGYYKSDYSCLACDVSCK